MAQSNHYRVVLLNCCNLHERTFGRLSNTPYTYDIEGYSSSVNFSCTVPSPAAKSSLSKLSCSHLLRVVPLRSLHIHNFAADLGWVMADETSFDWFHFKHRTFLPLAFHTYVEISSSEVCLS
jgi:hypothetical protein